MDGEFLIEVRDGEAHVLLTGDVDIAVTAAVRRAVERALDAPTAGIVINLDAVTFVDSTGLGAIVAAYRGAAALGKGYRITTTDSPAVARVVSISQLDGLRIEPSAECGDSPVCS